jgi:hypothetical protein
MTNGHAEADGVLLDEIAAWALLVRGPDPLRLSARGHHRVMPIARTLAARAVQKSGLGRAASHASG